MTTVPTTNKALSKQGTGDNVGTWGPVVNANFDLIDAALAGQVTIALTNANVTLTAPPTANPQSANLIYALTGTLTANVQVIFPAVGGLYVIQNGTTGAFTVTIASAGGGTSVVAPQGSRMIVVSDATNIAIADTGSIASSQLIADGGCRLLYTSSSSITLTPKNGGVLFINDVAQVIPSAGVVLNSPTLTAGTTYYVYAAMGSGGMTLELSTTGHTTNSFGREVKSGDNSRRLVGMVASGTANQFVDQNNYRGVLSYFHRRRREIVNSSNTSTSANTWTNVSGSFSYFLSWPDEDTTLYSTGLVYNTTASTSTFFAIYVDNALAGDYAKTYAAAANAAVSATAGMSGGFTEGLHKLQGMGEVSNGTGNYSLNIRGTIQG